MTNTWYHLTQNDGLQSIIRTFHGYVTDTITPRIPTQSHGEDQTTERVCVAPTIWQCVLSIPVSGRLTIYQLVATTVTPPIGFVADIHLTDEKWITEQDLVNAGGQIQLSRIGHVDKTSKLDLSLKCHQRMGMLPLGATEVPKVWLVTGNYYELQPHLIVG